MLTQDRAEQLAPIAHCGETRVATRMSANRWVFAVFGVNGKLLDMKQVGRHPGNDALTVFTPGWGAASRILRDRGSALDVQQKRELQDLLPGGI